VKLKNKTANLARKNNHPPRNHIKPSSWNIGASRTNVHLPWANIHPWRKGGLQHARTFIRGIRRLIRHERTSFWAKACSPMANECSFTTEEHSSVTKEC